MRFFGTPVRFTLWSLPFFFLFGSIGLQLAAKESGEVQLVFFVLSAACALVSLLLHERAHVFMAARYGIGCSVIEIHVLGGASILESVGKRPKEMFWIAFVGPLTSFGISAFIFVALTLFGAALGFSLFTQLLLTFMILNVLWGVFNLLPMFPLDGGRILHGVLWARMRYEYGARRATVKIGRITIVIVGLLAVAAFILGFLSLFSVIWFFLIAYFIWRVQDAALQHPGGF